MNASPTLNNQASNDNSRRPTGQSAPATSPTQPSLDGATFQCEFPGCERSFQTTIGRGQHHRRMHKVWYDQRIIAEGWTFGWTLEESSLLARREAELSALRVRAINQALQQAFPHRTIGASIDAPKPTRTWSPNIPDNSGSFQEAQLHHFTRVNTTGYQTEHLHDIVCDASNSSKSAIFERLSRYLRDVFLPGSPHDRPAAATHQQQQTRRQARRRAYATT